jgi:hypothetical protein
MRRLRYQKLVKRTFHQLRAECLDDEMRELIAGNGLPRFTITEIPSQNLAQTETVGITINRGHNWPPAECITGRTLNHSRT